MELEQVRSLARNLMDFHGLTDWGFAFDRGRRRAGACHWQKRKITLSSALMRLYDPETVRDTILHEIAHALVGEGHGHDGVWKAKAAQIGAEPKARLSAQLPSPEHPWVGHCPSCGAQRKLFRAPQRVVACGNCAPHFDSRFIFYWVYRGQEQPLSAMSAAYQKEYRRLRRAGYHLPNTP